MMGRKRVNIADVCSEIFAGGDAPKNKMSIIKTSEYTIPIYSNGEDREGLYGYTNYARVSSPSITISARGTIGYTSIRKEPFVPIVRLITITPIPELIDLNYLYYAVKNLSFAGSGTSIPQLTVPMVKKYSFPLPPLDEQRKIAEVLDKVSDLIAKRRGQLDKLDLLVKARFVEMFGDPVGNSMGWKKDLLSNVTSKIGSGATPRGGKETYQNEGIALIRSMNVHDGRFEYKELAFITNEQAKQLNNVTVEKDDVFINITGASVARSCVAPINILPARVNQHVAIIRCCKQRLNSIFLNQLFLNQTYKHLLISIGESGGATRQAITKQQLENIKVILPPIELQNQFADFVEQTEKTKTKINASLEKLEILKKALMQEYFG